MASRDIKDLSPAMQVLYNRHSDRVRRDPWMQQNGVSMLLICTYRSGEEQDKLYAQGRTTPGAVVTNARAGKSKHNVTLPGTNTPASEAYDIVPVINGKLDWSTHDDPATPIDELEVWNRIGAHGKAAGLKWYGDPDAPFREFPHFQNPAV